MSPPITTATTPNPGAGVGAVAPPSPPPRPRFWLEFRIFSDGLDTAQARALSQRGGHTSFARFADLPAELRLKIWEYLIAPRIVSVACVEATTASSSTAGPAAVGTEVPVLLHVSRETRRLALSRYEPAFAWKVPHVLAASMDFVGVGTGARWARQHDIPTWTWSQPRVWFNYGLDAVYLLGELEPYDSYGFNSPMAYFLRAEEARRVRRVAVAFEALRYGEAGSQQIFGALFHVVDRFAPADGRLIVAVTPRDEVTHALMGGEGPLVVGADGDEDNGWRGTDAEYEVRVTRRGGKSREDEVNVVQKTWRDWYRGSIIVSRLANMEFVLVRESDLERHIADSVASTIGNAASGRS
ncbi:hypothetical protein F4779DRAFT_582887 [Xylariaceae sp. FL0662B]|nr:hypothetical protein F4779DRAFT_582887 [Xylariaceae sp. FL0662B]